METYMLDIEEKRLNLETLITNYNNLQKLNSFSAWNLQSKIEELLKETDLEVYFDDREKLKIKE